MTNIVVFLCLSVDGKILLHASRNPKKKPLSRTRNASPPLSPTQNSKPASICCLKTITRALNRRLLRANGDRELGILRTLDAVADRQQTPGDGEERVHGFASAQARRGVLKESRLLVRVTGRRVNAVHIPRTSGGFDVREVKVHGFVAVLRLDRDRAARRKQRERLVDSFTRIQSAPKAPHHHHRHPNSFPRTHPADTYTKPKPPEPRDPNKQTARPTPVISFPRIARASIHSSVTIRVSLLARRPNL